MEFKKYMGRIRVMRFFHPEMSLGQACLESLWGVSPWLAESLQESEHNPFYKDERVPEFLEIVRKALDK
jgi:hypothetical protein